MNDSARNGAYRARVVIAQHRLLHYRQELFERLHRACEARRIELRLVHGQASRHEALKKDVGQLPWADVVRNRFLRIGEALAAGSIVGRKGRGPEAAATGSAAPQRRSARVAPAR